MRTVDCPVPRKSNFRRRWAVRFLLSLLFLNCLPAPLPGAEEAWRRDGVRLRGSLTLDGGRLRFQPSEGTALTPADLTRIRFPESTAKPFRVGGGRRVQLGDGEQLSGQILELNRDALRLRAAWAARVELPRAAVASVSSLPGWRTVLDEDFRGELKGFTLTGDPTRTDVEEEGTTDKALVLGTPGQRLNHTLKTPLSAGRVGVNFREQGRIGGARWTVELLFQQGDRSRRLTVTIAGDGDHYTVDTESLAGTARKAARTPGWHRLIVTFHKQSLRLTCDDEVLWYNLEQGAGGPLRRVTIRCQQSPNGEAVRGSVAWTEFCIERAVNEYPPPPPDDEQDAVRLLHDDQLFGRIVRADRRVLEIEGPFGKRSLPWTAVSGCTLRRPDRPPPANEGAKVRLLLRSGLGREPDVLEGVVTALDDRRVVLRHALLGELTLERGRVRELRPVGGASK